MSDLTLREDSREAITFTIKRNAVAYSITGMAVKMRRRSGIGTEDVFATTDASPLLVATTPASGILTFTPTANTWLYHAGKDTYEVYFDIEITAGNWVSWPEGTNLKIDIVKKYGT